MIRVFVGIPVSDELKVKISEWAESHKDLPLRFVAGTGLHITIVQPWYAESADCAVGEIKDLINASKPFRIRFKKITYGTSPKRPRLIWTLGEEFDRESMLNLKSVAERVFGQHPDARPYTPHITIARFKEDDFDKLPVKDLEDAIDWEMQVDSVVLYESKLNQTGAEYDALKKIELGILN